MKYELGQSMEGNCINCSGRGRPIHLEYNGDDEALCMVCSSVFKLEDVENE